MWVFKIHSELSSKFDLARSRVWILSRRTGHWHTPACPQNLCRKENIKKSSIRSHWPCQSILCFTTAPVVATAAPPPSKRQCPWLSLIPLVTKHFAQFSPPKGANQAPAGFSISLNPTLCPTKPVSASPANLQGLDRAYSQICFVFLLIELCTDNRASLCLPFSPLVPNSQHLPAAMNATCMTGTQALGLNEAVFLINIILAPKTTNYSKNKRQCQKDSVECIKKKLRWHDQASYYSMMLICSCNIHVLGFSWSCKLGYCCTGEGTSFW